MNQSSLDVNHHIPKQVFDLAMFDSEQGLDKTNDMSPEKIEMRYSPSIYICSVKSEHPYFD